MSIAALRECVKECQQLAVAGSRLAKGDFRLQRLVEPLRESGRKAAVFGKVAQAVEKVTDGPEDETAANLLHLVTLTHAVLYTQGQTKPAGESRELPETPCEATVTVSSNRYLRVVAVALTESGEGRIKVLREAHERGTLRDLRLLDYALAAVEDRNREVADFVGEAVLPAFGPLVAERIQADYDLEKGTAGMARRLKLLGRLLPPEDAAELALEALDKGKPELRAAAIECLAPHPEHLHLVQEAAEKDRSKGVREAAARVLVRHDDGASEAVLRKMIAGKDFEAIAEFVGQSRSATIQELLLAGANRALDELIAGGKKLDDKLRAVDSAVKVMGQRRDQAAEDFLVRLLEAGETIVQRTGNARVDGMDICRLAASQLREFPSSAATEAVIASRRLGGALVDQALAVAIRDWPPAKVYDEFHPLLAAGRPSIGVFYFPDAAPMDPRWLDFFGQHGDVYTLMQHWRVDPVRAGRHFASIFAANTDFTSVIGLILTEHRQAEEALRKILAQDPERRLDNLRWRSGEYRRQVQEFILGHAELRPDLRRAVEDWPGHEQA